MEYPSEDIGHVSCLLCTDYFPYLGPNYSEHLYKYHGVMKESHREYLAKVTNYKMHTGELPQINPDEDTSNYSTNANGNVGKSGPYLDADSRRQLLSPATPTRHIPAWKNLDPRIRKAFCTPTVNDGAVAARKDTSSPRGSAENEPTSQEQKGFQHSDGEL